MAAARTRISVGDKQRLIESFDRGEDYLFLAEQLGIKRTSAYSVVRRNMLPPRQNNWGGLRMRKMDNEMLATLQEIIEDQPAFTSNQIRHELHLRLPEKPVVGKTTITNALQARLITIKKLEDSPAERSSESTKNLRRVFAEWLLNDGIQRSELIFIDEAGVNLFCSRTRGRAVRGNRAVRVVNAQRGRNLTICFAVSSARGLVHHEILEGGMTNLRFRDFLLQVSTQGMQDAILICDNASAHRGALGVNRPQLLHQQSIRALPPYSPMLNIVENAISCYKAALKRDLEEAHPALLQMPHYERMAQLSGFSEVAIAAIQPQMAPRWFLRVQSFMPACIRGDDILM